MLRIVDIIEKKRNGGQLAKEEIDFFIAGCTDGSIPDYQTSALLMAVFFQGMTAAEQSDLTDAIVQSGDQIDLSAIDGITVDKHSTGGVGDTTTLILAPLVAACGVPVAKMSGRGLGHTGGTLDKLESIAGFHIELSKQQFIQQVNDLKIAVIGQSGNITPADKKLYALRDVTATVDSIPLIASSIMSKKIAAGADAIVLDVKTGAGAFMKTLDDSKRLADAMTAIGSRLGRRTTAVISDMSQPLGYAVGNALEVKEAIETLQGRGPADLTELCLVLGSEMLMAANKADSEEQARSRLKEAMDSGSALQLFKRFVTAQGGDSAVIDNMELLPAARWQINVRAKESGWISAIDADEIGTAAMLLGAGRAAKEDTVDLAVGIVLQKKIGDYVEKGGTLAVIHSNSESAEDSLRLVEQHMHISAERTEAPPLIYKL